MNKVMLVGRLTAEPELRSTQKQIEVAKFTVAVGRKDTADFIGCTAFGELGKLIERYVHKGHRIGVVGRIQTGSYEKDGKKFYTQTVVVDEAEFLESKAKPEQEAKPDIPAEYTEVDPDGELPF